MPRGAVAPHVVRSARAGCAAQTPPRHNHFSKLRSAAHTKKKKVRTNRGGVGLVANALLHEALVGSCLAGFLPFGETPSYSGGKLRDYDTSVTF